MNYASEEMAYQTSDTPTVTVSSSAELDTALADLAAGRGGTILLDETGGPYQIEMRGIGSAETPIVITSRDPEAPAVVEEIVISDASHLTVTGVRVDASAIAATRPDWQTDIRITDASDIAITGNVMTGTADGYWDGSDAVTKGDTLADIRSSTGITFSDNTVSDYYHGVFFRDVVGLTFTGNEMTGIQGDGLRGGGLQDGVIADNYMHDFYGSAQTLNHSDMIQIWGTNATIVNRDILITGNVLDAGAGAATQGILIRNETFDGTEGTTGYFQNITITDNLVHNGMSQGIFVADTMGLTIADNTVLWNQAATTQTTLDSPFETAEPGIVVRNVPDATLTGNVSGRIKRDGADVTAGNFALSYTDPTDAGYVHEHIVNLSGQGDLELIDLAFRQDSPLFGTLGADVSSAPAPEDGLVAALSQTGLEGNRLGLTLSAEQSLLGGAPLDPATAEITWIFSDGTVASGPEVSHIFDTPGAHEVALEIRTAEGRTDRIERMVTVDPVENFAFDFTAGLDDLSGRDAAVQVTDPNGTALGGAAGFSDSGDISQPGFLLDGESRLTLTRANEQIYNLDTFALDLTFALAEEGSAGRLVFLHRTLELKVTGEGGLTFTLKTDEGSYLIETEGGLITAGEGHEISVRYDGPAGTLELYVDGAVAGATEASGTTPPVSYHSLVLGNPWGPSAEGLVTTFAMSAPPSAIYADPLPPEDAPTGEEPTLVPDPSGAEPALPMTEEAEGRWSTLCEDHFDFAQKRLDPLYTEGLFPADLRSGQTAPLRESWALLRGDDEDVFQALLSAETLTPFDLI